MKGFSVNYPLGVSRLSLPSDRGCGWPLRALTPPSHGGHLRKPPLSPNAARRRQGPRSPSGRRRGKHTGPRGPPPGHSGAPEARNPGGAFPSAGFPEPAVLPARTAEPAGGSPVHHLPPGNTNPPRPWKPPSPAPSQRLPRDGHVRRFGPEAPTQAGAALWGYESRCLPTLPGPGRAGPRSDAGALASGLRLHSSPRPEAA